MGKHRRPGPPNQPSRAVPHADPNAPLAPFEKRRRPPMDVLRGFTYTPTGTAPNLAAARAWEHEADPGTTA
ncbi:hypothetical protein DEH69_03090 [Streptomyces sp. PT12]|nr:hypothetical protein DEH69_03090 [Streptomyces sp. PT12]